MGFIFCVWQWEKSETRSKWELVDWCFPIKQSRKVAPIVISLSLSSSPIHHHRPLHYKYHKPLTSRLFTQFHFLHTTLTLPTNLFLPLDSFRNGRWPHRPRWRSLRVLLRRLYPQASLRRRRSVRSPSLLLGPPPRSPIVRWRNLALPLLDRRADSRDFFHRLRNRVRFSIFVRYSCLWNIAWARFSVAFCCYTIWLVWSLLLC